MKKRFKINFFVASKIFVFSILLFFYFFQVTEVTKNLYVIRNYNRKISAIHEESRRAEYGFLKSNSISRTEELMEMNNFVRAENIYYVDLSEFEVALK